jgi:hypothetical protein
MAGNNDWLPHNHEDLYNQINQTANYIADIDNLIRMGLDSTNMKNWIRSTFQPAVDKFNAAYGDWKDEATRTRLNTLALSDAEKELRPLYRQLYTGPLKNNPLITNIDLEAMGLPLKPSKRHSESSPVPADYPGCKFDTSMLRRIIVLFFSLNKLVKRKPRGIHGCEMLWAIFDIPVTKIEDLSHSAFTTRSPYTFEFKDEDRGRYFCISLRWENTRGEKGPWSEIHDVIIP